MKKNPLSSFKNFSTLAHSFWQLPVKKRILYFAVLGVSLTLVMFLFQSITHYFYKQTIFSSLKDEKTVQYEAYEKNQYLVKINTLFELPQDENPIVGKIEDIDRLGKIQAYFKKSQKGDILVIYPNLTIIYRPNTNTIIDFAMVNLLKE